MIAGTLEVQMLANMARLQSDMTTAKNTVGSAMKGIESAVGSAKETLAALGIGLGVGYFATLIKGTIDAADKFNDLTQSMGISRQELANYQLATAQSGTSLEGLAKGIKGLSNAFAEHGKELKDAGITAETQDGKMRQLADIFSKMPDGIEKTALANKLFGKSGMDLIPMLNMGAKGLDETKEKSASYAAVMATLAPQADKFNDTMAELAMVSKVASMSLINDALPSMQRIAAAMAAAAHEGGMLKAAWVGLGGIGWEFIFKPLRVILLGIKNDLEEIGIGMLKWIWKNPEEAPMIQAMRAAIAARNAEISFVTSEGAAPEAAKAFDQAAWMAQYKKLMAAMGVGGKEKKEMTLDELLAKTAQTVANYNAKLEADATAANTKRVEEEDAARKTEWEKDAEAMTARIDAFDAMQVEMGKINLAAINQRAEDEKKAQKKIADNQKALEKEIDRGLTDALMRGFEGGKTFAYNFRDALVNMFKTMVLKPAIEFVLNPISGAIASAVTSMGLSGAANAAGGAGGIGSLASGASSAWNMYSGGSSAISNWVGSSMFGASAASATGMGTATTLAATDVAYTAVGASAGTAAMGAIGTAMPYIGAALFIASALGLFSGGGGPKQQSISLVPNQRLPGPPLVFSDTDIAGMSDAMRKIYDPFIAALNDPTKYDQAKLAGFVGQGVTAAPGTSLQDMLNQFMVLIEPAKLADTTQALADQAAAAQAAADAAAKLTSAWQTVTDSIVAEIQRIKGLLGGGAGSLAMQEAQFAIATGQARAGDIEAAKLLPGLSQSILDLSLATASNALDVARVRGWVLGNLETTAGLATSTYGLTVPSYAVGTEFVPFDQLAKVHRGESVTTAPENAAISTELRALRAEMAAIRKDSKRTADTLEQVSYGQRSLSTVAA